MKFRRIHVNLSESDSIKQPSNFNFKNLSKQCNKNNNKITSTLFTVNFPQAAIFQKFEQSPSLENLIT